MADEALYPRLVRLGFRIPESTLDALIKELTRAKRGPREVIDALAEAERRARDDRYLERRRRQAMLGNFKSLDQFDWARPTKIDRGLYEELLTLDFLKHSMNAMFRGAVGLGKTTLAKNLGMHALQAGYSVRFATLASMLGDISRPETPALQQRRLRRYTQPDLLIVDEIGYLPFDAKSGDIFYNVIAERHERRSTVVTTNLPFKAWGGVLGDAASVVALVDRFSENLRVIDIEGETCRRPPRAPSSQVDSAKSKKPRPNR